MFILVYFITVLCFYSSYSFDYCPNEDDKLCSWKYAYNYELKAPNDVRTNLAYRITSISTPFERCACPKWYASRKQRLNETIVLH